MEKLKRDYIKVDNVEAENTADKVLYAFVVLREHINHDWIVFCCCRDWCIVLMLWGGWACSNVLKTGGS